MKQIILFAFFFLSVCAAYTQSKSEDYTVFYHENGQISSEGTMQDGKPDGYWKTYFTDGVLKSEGNRKDLKLDSLWTFYDETGKISMQIEYKNDLKNGIRRTYLEDEIIEENFIDDVKQGYTYHYHPDGKLWKEIFFENGLESGIGKEYAASDGRIIKLTYFEKGYILDIENINRYDRAGFRQGKWVFFYDNGNIKEDGEFRNDLKHGYFKYYSQEGILLLTSKYLDGVLQEDVEELARLDIKREYYPSGQVKTMASFKDDVPQGIRREYSPDGDIIAGYVFDNGIVAGEGITDEEGLRHGLWKEYYHSGQLKSIGHYDKGKRTDEWKFYYPTGQLEQSGFYSKDGKPNGEWKWYYITGSLLKQESYFNGFKDGFIREYDPSGYIIAEGEFIEGNKEGIWKYNYGDQSTEGEYLNGMQHGSWKYYYSNGRISFEGAFIDDNPNGKHTWYWSNGNKKIEGNYSNGLQHGEWTKYYDDGTLFITILYENGIERRIDGIRINISEEYDEDVLRASSSQDFE